MPAGTSPARRRSGSTAATTPTSRRTTAPPAADRSRSPRTAPGRRASAPPPRRPFEVAGGTESLDRCAGSAATTRSPARNGSRRCTALTFDGGAGDDTLLGGERRRPAGRRLRQRPRRRQPGHRHALLGGGNDTFQWDPGDGSDTVEGQTGTDTLDFNGSNIGEQIDVSRQRRPRPLHAQHRRDHAWTSTTSSAQRPRPRRRRHVTVNDLTGTDAQDRRRRPRRDRRRRRRRGRHRRRQRHRTPRDVVQVSATGTQVRAAAWPRRRAITGSEPALDTLLIKTLDGNDTSPSPRSERPDRPGRRPRARRLALRM